ncbi:MAG: hypothetical protein D6746_05575 [Bacteroidetes bacterium]|nr:MAG: hypothetical protein D6746_05575 [Bacteroidota bacterium]
MEHIAINKRPLLSWIPKVEDFYGDVLVVPVLYENPQSAGIASLSTAVANAQTTKQVKFQISARKKAYGAVQIEAEAMMAAAKDVGAFIRAKDTQIRGMLRQMGKQAHLSLYRDGSGTLGVVSSVSSNTITLTRKADVYNFGEGQVLQADTGGNKTARTGTMTVVKVNHAAGTIEVDSLVSGTTTSDHLYTQGNIDAVITGLEGWIPLTAPGSSDSFFGVNRSVNVAALSGHRVNDTSRSILTNAEELAMLIGEFGGEPDALFLNPRAGLQLSQEVGAKVERTDGGRADVLFNGFTLHNFVTGPISVIFDPGCPQDRGYMLQRNTWKVHHLGGFPHLISDDGRDSLRSADGSYDGIEVRARYFAELACDAPGYNGVMAVAVE